LSHALTDAARSKEDSGALHSKIEGQFFEVEGNSIRSTERMTDTHRDTVMRLGVEVGMGCAKLMDERMR